MLNLNPDGKCRGANMKGCPHGASAPPPKHENGLTTVRYHCDKCFPVYCRRYNTRSPED